MKCFVTGGSGFIGSALVSELRKRRNSVFNYDLVGLHKSFRSQRFVKHDIRNKRTLHKRVEGFQPHILFHLAGLLGTSELMQDVKVAEEVNIGGTINVLEICKEFEIPLIFVSKINPRDWLNPYTITKEACDSFCHMYRKVWGLKVVIIKPFNVYGPGQLAHPVQKYVPAFIERALRGWPIPVWGTGKQSVDPVYIDDVVEALIRAEERQCWGETIHVGLGEPVPVIDVARMVVELTESDSPIRNLPMRLGEPEQSTLFADTYYMETLLKMKPSKMVQLREGLTKTIEWWRRR